MDENIAQNPPQEPASYTRPNNSSPKFFDKFSSFFTKKTVAVLVILVLIIGVGAATIAVQRSTEIRQRAVTAPTPPCYIPASLGVGTGGYGDVNGDGQVNSIDSNLILQFSGGLITFTPAKIEAADVNGPPNVLSSAGDVNSIDSSLILQYVAALISTFPVCSSSTIPTPTPTVPSSGSVISGTVFQDDNGNAIQDSGETDYSGTATIKLENGVTATKYLGGYYFTGVASGTHTVTLTVPSGYTATTKTSFSVTVPPNGIFKFGIKSTTISPSPTPQLTKTPTPTTPPGVTVTPTPRLSTTPTPTIPAGNAILALAIGLDAIGNTGDNNTPNDSSGSNKNPKRPTRNVTVELFNASNNQPVGTKRTGTVAYVNGLFTGSIDLGTGFTTGSYNIKVKSDGYLRRKALGITLTAGRINTLTKISLVAGDINIIGDIKGDNAIDIRDYNILISCLSDPTQTVDNHALCNSNAQYAVLSDLDDNGVVDQLDYNLFRRELSVQNGD